jgi:hypothetical protein
LWSEQASKRKEGKEAEEWFRTRDLGVGEGCSKEEKMDGSQPVPSTKTTTISATDNGSENTPVPPSPPLPSFLPPFFIRLSIHSLSNPETLPGHKGSRAAQRRAGECRWDFICEALAGWLADWLVEADSFQASKSTITFVDLYCFFFFVFWVLQCRDC